MLLNVPVSSTPRGFLPCLFRRFSLSIAPERNINQAREARVMNKLINSSKKKRKYFICETPTNSGAIHLGKELRPSRENSRRVAVLNKLFIKNISDLLATGSFSESVLDKGLEISKVQIASDFKQVNVYWATNNEENLQPLKDLLPDVGFKLRHELTQLRVIGSVPRIVFVEDKFHAVALQVDHLLKIADYGDDHVPFNSGSDFKNSEESEANKINTQEYCVNADGDSVSKEEQPDLDPMPVMRQDVFNLNHESIMKKIVKSMHKSRALHRFEPNLAIACEGTNTPNIDETNFESLSKNERKKAISKFILERKLQQKRLNKFNDLKLTSDLNSGSYEIGEYKHDEEEEDYFTEEDFIEEDSFEDKRYNN